MKAKEKLKINQDLCLRCGGCVAAYPDVFEFDASGDVQVKDNAEIDIELIPKIKAVCPVAAIIDN